MRGISIAFVLFCLTAVAGNAFSQVNFSGYLKNYTVIQDAIDTGPFQFDRSYRMQNSGRFMIDAFNGNQVWQLHYEFGLDSTSQLQRIGESFLAPERQSYRLTDLDSTIGRNDKKIPCPKILTALMCNFSWIAAILPSADRQ